MKGQLACHPAIGPSGCYSERVDLRKVTHDPSEMITAKTMICVLLVGMPTSAAMQITPHTHVESFLAQKKDACRS